jgi:hypothetical protein
MLAKKNFSQKIIEMALAATQKKVLSAPGHVKSTVAYSIGIAKNIKIAMELSGKLEGQENANSTYRIDVGPETIQFVPLKSCNASVEAISYGEKNFKKKVKGLLEQYGFMPQKRTEHELVAVSNSK